MAFVAFSQALSSVVNPRSDRSISVPFRRSAQPECPSNFFKGSTVIE